VFGQVDICDLGCLKGTAILVCSEIRMIPSWLLLAIIVGGGIIVVAANSLYPIAKEREAKERLAQDAKTILLSEVESNAQLVKFELDLITKGQVNDAQLSVSAWETVSKGGLLLGLKPVEITKFLQAYEWVFRANMLTARIMNTIVGVDSAMVGVADTRNHLITELKDTLTRLGPLLDSLEKL
jgi:hypothetical protein